MQLPIYSKPHCLPRFQSLLAMTGMGVAMCFGTISSSVAAGMQTLHDHVPPVVARLHLPATGRLAETRHLHLAIGLPLRNPEALDDFLQQLYDPASPNFHQYLTPEQFTEQFGPTEQDYQTVIAFARANGLRVTGTHPNRMLLDVDGTVANVEKALHVTMRTYQHPKENRTFYAPDVEPSVESGIPILHISGLDNYELPHPKIVNKTRRDSLTNAVPQSGSGPGGSYLGNDFRQAYLPGVSLTGAGQIVGLLEFDGYYSNDIAAYENISGLPGVMLTNVLIGSFSGNPGGGNVEVALDIDVAMAMAPGLSQIIVYEAPNTSPWPDILSRMANDNLAKQLSCSWGGGSPDPTSELIFKQMAAQGQSFFNASGDWDAFFSYIPFPSESTNTTQVGGTTLMTTGPGGVWVLETTWSWGGGIGSSGGVSTNYSIPVWQQGLDMTTNQGSTTFRNVPDVAWTADNVFIVANNGIQYVVAGTSAAAPLWAGFIALVNQQAVAGGKPTAGFINPAIYSLGKGTSYLSDFDDIVTGNNFWYLSTNQFSAVPGYDLCTGWGTPAGENLIDALATVSDALEVAPGRGFVASGPVGGAFTVGSQNFLLTNSGAFPLNWSLINTSLWLAASATNGTLTPGGLADNVVMDLNAAHRPGRRRHHPSGPATNVVMSLNAAAYNLSPGVYTANVLFTNKTSHAVRTRQFVLLVGQQMIQNGGFESGTLSYWMQAGPPYSYYYDFADDEGSFSGIPPHSGNYLAALGAYGALGYLSQTLSTVSNQAYLISLWLNSPTNVSEASGGQVTSNTPNEFSVSWNGTTLFDQVDIGPIGWTNMVFIVTATNSSSVLQLGGRADPWFLGLDDVNIWPIPNPFTCSVVKTNGNNLVLSWNSLSNIAYQVQYSTNLTETNWVILSTNTATGPVMTCTNAYGSDLQRFYRIRRLP
ncbi:MAG: protease pro-enzyme activation domain-containing protein [Verrucomicrobiota bacterium]